MNTRTERGVVFYRAADQTAAGASAEASSLGVVFGVSCRDGVYWIYDTRQVAAEARRVQAYEAVVESSGRELLREFRSLMKP